MSLTVFLDSGPLGISTNPKRPPETVKPFLAVGGNPDEND